MVAMGGASGELNYNLSDLLNRQEIQLEQNSLKAEVTNKVIAITGAGGSIGSEIARQVSRLNPKKILLIGHGENSIYLIYHELLKESLNVELIPIIADIKDYSRIKTIFETHRPDIVYHAAAHKHVPLMELNPIEAFTNNIQGTYNVARAVDAVAISKMVMVSTDKAVKPTSVMGASKRIAELIMTSYSTTSQSQYCTVRFGNVLGSRGSVLPMFEKQIKAGGPLTITDKRMTRYLLTPKEASQLVIFAGTLADRANLFILNMGEPVKVIDLAQNLVDLSGSEIPIIETGIRPGEKIHEDLLDESENKGYICDGNIIQGHIKTLPLSTLENWIDLAQSLPDSQLKKSLIQFANDSYSN